MMIISKKTSSALFALIGVVALAAACHTDSGSEADLSVDEDLAAGIDLGDADLVSGADLACTPEVQSCTGLCGPVRDNCTGDTFQCGACATGTVCDLDAHVCIVPKADCVALGKVCGTTKNSCGQTISCTPFTCTDTGQECDPDSNQCITCTAATCEDLGFECGLAWLGCGPQSNTTDCGACASDKNCNTSLHVCESKTGGTCGGMTAKQMCDAAKAARAIECGVITNGCGGLIDCTATDAANYKCRAGLTCGGAGVPNRCAPAEPPTECFVAGYNCGTLPSACGGTVNCGTCDASIGDQCNLASGSMAGTCGPACTMGHKTCSSDYVGKCGKALNDNCWPAIPSCDCPGGQVCSTSVAGQLGTCSVAKACADYGANGAPAAPCTTSAANTAFAKGDGSFLTCDCSNPGAGQGQEQCLNKDVTGKGACCKHPTCQVGDVTIADPCTGGTINCCPGGTTPYMGTCCSENACPNDSTYYPAFDRGCGLGTKVCACPAGTDNPKPPINAPTACCPKPAACPAGQCSGTGPVSACSGNSNTCSAACAPGAGGAGVCVGVTCCAPTTACPNDGIYRTNFNNGCQLVTCGCPSGTIRPKNAAGQFVSGAHCCTPPAACGNNCNGMVNHTMCDAGDATVVPDVTQAPNTCGAGACGSGKCCNAGTCQAANTPACGNSCPSVTDSCGNAVPCNCPSTKSCVGNMCTCPLLPSCNTACPCGGSQLCNGGTCCLPKTCPADLPVGQQCGTIADSCTGSSSLCDPCKSILGNFQNVNCNTTTHQCQCAPVKCCKDTGGVQPCIQPGAYSPALGFPDHNDGCGGSGTCSS